MEVTANMPEAIKAFILDGLSPSAEELGDIGIQGLSTLDIPSQYSSVVGSKVFVDPEDGKLRGHRSMSTDSPWEYTVPDPTRDCEHWRRMAWRMNFVPNECIHCWKVVGRPRRLSELFKVRQYQLDHPDQPAKVGTEEREWTPGALYGAYWYCDGEAEGQARFDQICRDLPNLDLVLKRYCTEYEVKFGDTKTYKQIGAAGLISDLYRAAFDIEPDSSMRQPWYVRAGVWVRWIRYGWRFGTQADREEIERQWNAGQPLYTQPRKYLERKRRSKQWVDFQGR